MIIGKDAVPSPCPKYIHRLLLPPFETTQSIFPSRLKSPVATPVGRKSVGSDCLKSKPGNDCGVSGNWLAAEGLSPVASVPGKRLELAGRIATSAFFRTNRLK